MMPSNNKIVYNNKVTGSNENNGSEETSTKPINKKPHSMKCNNCAWSTIEARKHPNVIYTMKRIYIRHKNKWKPIGWYCNHCGSIVLDELVKPNHGYFRPPDPKITISETKYKW